MASWAARWGVFGGASLLCLIGCGGSSTGRSDPPQPVFDDGNVTSLVQNSRYFPLQPGSFTLALEFAEPRDLLVETRVSHFPSTIDGRAVTVSTSRSFDNGIIVEQRIEYFNQDSKGNVWIFGADVSQFIAGIPFGNAGSWRVGEDGAEPGLILAGAHQPLQTYVREVETKNRRIEVVSLESAVDSEIGRFENCLEFVETGFQTGPFTYFLAPDIGPVLIQDRDEVPRWQVLERTDDRNPVILPGDFVTGVTNTFFPLTTGQIYVYTGTTEFGVEDREVERLSTTSQIIGVTCRENRETRFVDGEKVSETLRFYAQDDDGTVWLFGEEVILFDDMGAGTPDEEASWVAGIGGAQPGIEVLASPAVGNSHRREFAVGVAEEIAIVTALDALVSTDAGTFLNCMELAVTDPLVSELQDPASGPEAVDRFHFYAPGAGLVEYTDSDGMNRFSLREIR